jgi:predicted secreted protein
MAQSAFAQSVQSIVTQAQPSGVLSLSAQASEDVPQDVVDITLFYEQEAKDAASLTSVLNERADKALRMAKGVENVTAHSGSFTVYPSTDRDGRISAWRGRTEVVLESKDFTAASKLAGKMSDSMQVGSVTFSLSPQAQREQKLSTQAIASFKQQAQSSAQAFGYSGYAIREVNIGRSGSSPRPVMMMAARNMSADAKMAAPMALEAGTSTVTVNVSGSVQMNR